MVNEMKEKLENILIITRMQLAKALRLHADECEKGNISGYLQCWMSDDNLCIEYISILERAVSIVEDGLRMSTIIEIKPNGTHTSKSNLVKWDDE
jgi:hypothetical protein